MKTVMIVSSILLMCLLSGCSDSDSGPGTAPEPVPAAPSGLAVTDEGLMSMTLSWNTSDNATGYKLYRSESPSGDFVQVYSGALTEVVDAGLEYVKTYYYQVSAVNSSGESVRSANVNGTTDTPAGFVVSGSPSGRVDYTFSYNDIFNSKPRYQSNPIGLNIMVPISGDHAGQWCFYDQIEGIVMYYHPTDSDYPAQTGWIAVLGDTPTQIYLTPFSL
jgi:hypothetical protein